MDFSSKLPTPTLPQQSVLRHPVVLPLSLFARCCDSVQTPSLLIIVACCLTFKKTKAFSSKL